MQAYRYSLNLPQQVFSMIAGGDTRPSRPVLATRAARSSAALPLPPGEAHPMVMLATLCTGAGVGVFVARVVSNVGASLGVGALAGASLAGLAYALSVCLPACVARDCSESAPVGKVRMTADTATPIPRYLQEDFAEGGSDTSVRISLYTSGDDSDAEDGFPTHAGRLPVKVENASETSDRVNTTSRSEWQTGQDVVG